ncbi:phosphatase PAP2 family protein [uncultured Acetobacteroides sp.]|uniref:phosphatase PAP2 family protein n=1 Tax=uncultured Acetobacteroides sp. TaxID=1760811 RepID=UPI0029F4C17A|nr:phosphatase PAP2 family protein [uncultured Acetobacteroides sp.]
MKKGILLLVALAAATLQVKAQIGNNADTTLLAKPISDSVSVAGVKPSHITTVAVNDTTAISYIRPQGYHFITNIPKDWLEFGQRTVSKKGLITVGALAASTALLMTIDRPAMDAVQQFGRWAGVSGERKFANTIKFKMGGTAVNFMDLPQNLNSTLYFIGEGWPTIAFTAGVLVKGLITNDNRAIQTASQIGEGYLAMGITVQLIKRLTGRQSPFKTTKGSGNWQLAPAYSHYQGDVPNHDAFPSGHLATAMASITIYAENYPEIRWIRPVGYTVMGLVGLAMMNNGVHWMSDYPLAIAIGYTYGKIVTSRDKSIRVFSRRGNHNPEVGKLSFGPKVIGSPYYQDYTLGLSLSLTL